MTHLFHAGSTKKEMLFSFNVKKSVEESVISNMKRRSLRKPQIGRRCHLRSRLRVTLRNCCVFSLKLDRICWRNSKCFCKFKRNKTFINCLYRSLVNIKFKALILIWMLKRWMEWLLPGFWSLKSFEKHLKKRIRKSFFDFFLKFK